MPDGRLIGRIITARTVANLCFGGADWRTLYITAQPNVLSIPLRVAGAVSLKPLQVASVAGDAVQVSWPWPSTGLQLQVNQAIETEVWTGVEGAPSVSNGFNHLSFTLTNTAAFFRLGKPPP
jgi:hypothetical protein